MNRRRLMLAFNWLNEMLPQCRVVGPTRTLFRPDFNARTNHLLIYIAEYFYMALRCGL